LKKVTYLVVIFIVAASFLAIVPIKFHSVQAAVSSFGHTELGTTYGVNGFPAVYVSAFQAPMEADRGVMTEIVCAVKTMEGSGFMVPVVYAADGASNNFSFTGSSSAKDPSTLLSTGPPVAIGTSMEWKQMSLSTPVTIQGGQLYYLGYLTDVGTYPSQDYRNPPPTPTSIFDMELAGGWNSYPNPPSPFGNITYVHAGVNILAVYAVYTVAIAPNNATQFKVNFSVNGLGADAVGENATIAGEQWVESGASLPFSFAEVVSSSINGKRYVLSGVNATSPLTVTDTTTITASYTTQYQVSFISDPIDAGTITPSEATNVWVDAGSFSLSATANEGYAFSSWEATGAISLSSEFSNSATAAVDGTGTITAKFIPIPVLSVPFTFIFVFVVVIIAFPAVVVSINWYKRKANKRRQTP
jgi:hypothetical protein